MMVMMKMITINDDDVGYDGNNNETDNDNEGNNNGDDSDDDKDGANCYRNENDDK